METILIIEDSMVVQEKLREILTETYRLEIRGDGCAGFGAAQTHRPDLILLDIHLPGLDGYEVCRRLKADAATSDIPVVFLTAMDSEKERVKGFAAGGSDYVIKPFFPEELLARIDAHLANRRSGRQAVELEKLKLFREMAVALNHEINNPLTAAYASLYMLEREVAADDRKSRQCVQDIRGALERIREITARLAHASKIETVDYDASTTMIDLQRLE
ncbi:MAG: response regulator [Geobacter sp.]|nr:response regulator [Geobacter sp.]